MLRVGDKVEVVGMAPEEECQHEMYVLIRGNAGPLAQPEGVAVDEQTRQVIEDWQHWVAQGYELLVTLTWREGETAYRPAIHCSALRFLQLSA